MSVKLRKYTTTQLISIGFAGAILIGALLLTLPICSANGQGTNFVDALFTATTSVCVTGLTTLSTANHWSTIGKVVIFALIQFGGLGIVTTVTMILVMLGKRVTLSERKIVQESYGLDTMSGMVKVVKNIVKGTLVVEFIGAIIYMTVLIPKFGIKDGFIKSIFLAVSAFCNAGMDTLGDSSLANYSGNLIINLNTMMLIVMGGIGFIVWWDVWGCIKSFKTDSNRSIKKVFRKLNLHSKLAILITAILIIVGAFLIFVFEYNNPNTLGEMPLYEKILASFFESVTFRTAGFYTFAQEELRTASIILGLLLMFIGGSPVGTAGGMKTTTIGMIVLTALSTAQSKKDTEIFRRRISYENIRTGLAVVITGFLVLFTSVILMCVAMPDAPLENILFELTSAVATVGLSRAFTGSLTTVAKLIVICTMYLGRIGPITIVIALSVRKNKNRGEVDLPENRIIVG